MNNFDKIKKAVAASGFDAVMATSSENRMYATGFHSTAGLAFVTADSAWFFTDSRYIEAAGNSIKGAKVIEVGNDYTYTKAVSELIISEKIEKLGFEDATMNVAEYLLWKEKLDVELIPAQKLFTNLRMVKSREEFEMLVKAQRIAEKAFNEIIPLITTDITEKELAAELVYRFMLNGAEDKSFDPIIVSGPRSSMPHGVPTDNKVEKGFITFDFGAKYQGWCSDTTRTLCVGQPTDEMRKVYNTVLEAQLAGIAIAKAGVNCKDVDKAARDVIHNAGYGGRFGHGYGHGLGLEIHEDPRFSPTYDFILPAGAMMSAEPGIYIPGELGVRIEDVIYITEDGCENITNLDKQLIIL